MRQCYLISRGKQSAILNTNSAQNKGNKSGTTIGYLAQLLRDGATEEKTSGLMKADQSRIFCFKHTRLPTPSHGLQGLRINTGYAYITAQYPHTRTHI